MPALPRDREEHLDLPYLPWRRNHRAHGTAGGSDQSGDPGWAAHPAGWEGECRIARRATGRPLRYYQDGRSSGVSSRRRRHTLDRAGDRDRSGAGSEDRGTDDRWTDAFEDSAGDAIWTKATAAGERRALGD